MAENLVRRIVQRARGHLERRRLKGMTRRDVFTEVYAENLWRDNESGEVDFYSGPGSHESKIVDPYVAAISTYLQGLGKPSVVDLGCGDFAVGSKLRPNCSSYIAADIVPPLIERNRKKFADLGVDFRVIDIVADELPRADVIMIRQVLQHLSNSDISMVVEKIKKSCKFLIFTEHLPTAQGFVANKDKPYGPDIRLYQRDPSGIVLTESPFNLITASQRVLCDVPDGFGQKIGRVETIAYEL